MDGEIETDNQGVVNWLAIKPLSVISLIDYLTVVSVKSI
jgi:hypothetical protein